MSADAQTERDPFDLGREFERARIVKNFETYYAAMIDSIMREPDETVRNRLKERASFLEALIIGLDHRVI